MTDLAPVTAGARISEYVLLEPLGSGSFGSVWKARHHVWEDQLVAVKIAHDAQLAKTLAKEGAVIHGLNHPHIVRAIGLDPFADPPYLVMEYVPGQNLRERLAAGQVPVGDAVEIFRQVMVALSFAHERGVIHRDIKPENVLLADRPANADGGPRLHVKLADFGLGLIGGGAVEQGSIMRSSLLSDESARQVAGTIAYMAPEARDGHKPDPRSDLFSAGIVLFETLTGQLPVGREMPGDLRADVPAWLNQVFEKCYARLERRWASAQAILDALAQHDRGVTPPPLPWVADLDRSLAARAAPAPSAGGAVRAGRPGMITCGTCGQVCPGTDNFCTACGSQLVREVRRCRQCGAFPAPDDSYCIFCGSRLAEERA